MVYVDGSHRAADVYSDGVLAWPLMARSGIVIFDDYELDEIKAESERPKPGIDAFLAAFEGQYRLVHRAIRSRSSSCNAIDLTDIRRFTASPRMGQIGLARLYLLDGPHSMSIAPGFSLARRLRAGETVYSGWCGLAAPIVAELVAREGFTAVTLDRQHGLWDTASVGDRGRPDAARRRGPDRARAARRVRDREPRARFRRRRHHRADDQHRGRCARLCVRRAKFPPIGERSWGPHRATTLAGMPTRRSICARPTTTPSRSP